MKGGGYKTAAVRSEAQPSTASTPIRQDSKSSTLYRRFSLAIIVLGLYAVLTNNMATTSTTDTHLSKYTSSIFLPFVFKFSSKHVPQVMCTIDGVDIKMPVDTGSTGLLIGAPILSNISDSTGTPAYHFFTSSKILYVGRLVELPVHFHGAAGSSATADVPVLIVDKSWRCPWYNPNKDRFECPKGPNGETPMERDTSRITYMGVGFGRNGPGDGMPFATPNANPFLNINAINGLPVSNKSIMAGYMISKGGVHVGLTSENARGFAWTSLEPGLSHAEDPRDWAMAKMCFSINNGSENCGDVLVDTGISQMYIRAVEGVSIPTVVIRNPNKHGFAKMVKRVKPGTNITVGFPSLDAPAASYSFVVGQNFSSTEPSYVVPAKPLPPPFINTGRNFLFGYSIAFDAVGGRFGLHPASSSSTSSSL